MRNCIATITTAVVPAFFATTAIAQAGSDESVASTYRSQCSTGDLTELCRSLKALLDAKMSRPHQPAIDDVAADPLLSRYGLLGKLAGSTWKANDELGSVFRFEGLTQSKGNELFKYQEIQTNKDYRTYWHYPEFKKGSADHLVRGNWDYYLLAGGQLLVDGGMGRYLFELIDQNTLKVSRVKVVGNEYVSKDPSKDMLLTRMSSQQSARFNQAFDQAKSSVGEGSGMFGRILGSALMGAMLGGGGQNSVDLAVAGAQAAANGGNTLDVLNSMGDVASVKQAESARHLNDTIARAQATSDQSRTEPTSGATSSGKVSGQSDQRAPDAGPVAEAASQTGASSGSMPGTSRSPAAIAEEGSSSSTGGETYQETSWFSGISMISEEEAWADAFAACAAAGKSCWKGTKNTIKPGYYHVDAIYYTGRTLTRGHSSKVTGQ